MPDVATTIPGLPAEASSFVGRRAERRATRSLLSQSRLVTLTGFGGVGKTRLALRVASELRRAFPDGVCFVSLGAHSDPQQVAFAVASSLGLQDRSRRSTATLLTAYLRERSMLIVLDNCEHVIDEAAELASSLIESCPAVRVLATSREPLRIPGEAVQVLAPMPVPLADGDVPLHQYESVLLFLDRARAAVAEFELTDVTQAPVRTIVTRLEGIPLALELAAGRLRAMSPDDIAGNLTEKWELLNRGTRTAPDRQRTMASCIEWSFDLCSPTEQNAWSQLAVFVDGFELDAARSVCADLTDPVEDVVAALVDKSILTAAPVGTTTRYRMLPPIRQRGMAQLRGGNELTATRRRHRDWCLDLAHRVVDAWLTPRQVEGIDRLRREMANMNACLEFCWTEPGEADAGLQLGAQLLEFGLAVGALRQGRRWFDKLLAVGASSKDTEALALRTAAWWAAMQGDVTRATDLVGRGAEIAHALGGQTLVKLTQAEGLVAMFAGDLDVAQQKYDEAIEGFRTHADEAQLAHTLALTALNCLFRNDLPAVLRAHEACVAITQPRGECWYRSYALWVGGLALWASGRADEATVLEQESLRLRRQTRDPLGVATSVEAVAWMVVETDPALSARLLGGARAIWDRIDMSTASLAHLHDHHVACEARARQLLSDPVFADEFERGKAMNQDELIADAIGDHSAPLRNATERATPPDRATKRSPLTRREREVATLVATGMTNKDIAAQLVISVRTAETHVEHILTKLGFNNRNQISAWVNEQQT